MPINYKNYPKDWKAIRARILERDDHKCAKCSIPDRVFAYTTKTGARDYVDDPAVVDAMSLDGFKFSRVVLTVAHLDHDIKNNDDQNLAALCQRCHLAHDAQQHATNAAITRRL